MKFTIDTEAKTLTIHENLTLGQVAEIGEDYIGEGWRDYKILQGHPQIVVPPYRPCSPHDLIGGKGFPTEPYQVPHYPIATWDVKDKSSLSVGE